MTVKHHQDIAPDASATVLWWCALLLILQLIPAPVCAARAYSIEMPEDLDSVDFYLHTVDVGDHVYDNFGHTAVRVHDRVSGWDAVFNWGVFDFGEPLSFSLTFYRGILQYRLGIYPYASAKMQYRYGRRTVWEDKIMFTRSQKQAFMRRLIQNARPENRIYPYQYFLNNCSTIPRDYIDAAIDGRLSTRTRERTLEETFRDSVLEHFNTIPVIAMGLDVLMNSHTDRAMTLWEKAYLPLSLREILLTTPGDMSTEGKALPMLSEGRILFRFPTPTPAPIQGHSSILLLFIPPLFWVIATLGPGMWRKGAADGTVGRPQRMGFRVLGVAAILWGGLSSIYGILMPLNWVLTAHTDLHHSANILVFWFFDFLLLVWGFSWLRRGRPHSLAPRRYWICRGYCQLHLVVLVFVMLGWGLGVFDQDIERVACFNVPISLVIYGLASVRGFVKPGHGVRRSQA